MLVKSLVAGTVLTLLAGGVVYYGTDVDGNISATSLKDSAKIAMSELKGGADDANTDEVVKTDMVKDESSKDAHTNSEKVESSSESSVDIPSIKTADGPLIDPKSASVKVEEDVVLEAEVLETDQSVESVEMDSDVAKEMPETTQAEKPTRKWIDQYLKSEPQAASNTPDELADEATAEIEAETDAPDTIAEDTMDEMEEEIIKEMDIELFTDEEILEAEAKGFEDRAKDIENIWIEKEDSETNPKTLHDILESHDGEVTDKDKVGKANNVDINVMKDEDGTTTIETETIDMGDGKVMKIVKKKRVSESYGSGSDSHENDEKKIRIKVITDDDIDGDMKPEIIDMGDKKIIKIRKSMPGNSTSDKSTSSSNDMLKGLKKTDISGTAKIVMDQAKKISMPELRDRAYLDLVSYALENGDKSTANIAMSKIEQVELRDTARNRMAVAYAKSGNADKAFAILEDIEVDALRDVMRLQVIEALIVPETAPAEDMQ